ICSHRCRSCVVCYQWSVFFDRMVVVPAWEPIWLRLLKLQHFVVAWNINVSLLLQMGAQGDAPTVDTAEQVYISSLALLKVLSDCDTMLILEGLAKSMCFSYLGSPLSAHEKLPLIKSHLFL